MPQKRAPGGGRKPKGEFSGKSATFSTRITPNLRKALDAAAKKSGRSLSQEVEHRLADSIYGRSDDRATRAFCFLISELARAVGFGHWDRNWHNDPRLREIFKLAIPMLLDRIPVMSGGDTRREPSRITTEDFAS